MPHLQERLRNTLPQEAYDLFVVFGRFEYAMKQGGFRRAESADAAWETFARAIPRGFWEQMSADANAEILFRRPPRRLIHLPEGGVDWSDPLPTPTDNWSLIKCVMTVRNNLLHGDKHIGRERDLNVILAALHVLNSTYDYVQNNAAFVRFIQSVQHELD